MFVSAMADAFSDLRAGALAMIERSGFPLQANLRPHSDGTLRGYRFDVDGQPLTDGSYPALDRLIKASAAKQAVRDLAGQMLSALAEAEAKVHGIAKERVHFHEIGGWDTVVDLLLAAFFAVESGAQSWSCSPLPLGGGTVDTAHGRLPVPAPATLELLPGFAFVDDGIGGERVTPTGAAILHALSPGAKTGGRLVAAGYGFGSRRMPGLSNVLRVSVFADSGVVASSVETIGVLTFEVDDQSAEDLAVAVDRLRGLEGVIDVSTGAMFGKKGRLATHVQVLADEAAAERVAAACLAETTTLGVRVSTAVRHVLPRSMSGITVDGTEVRVKTALTPAGKRRIKAEMDDCAGAGDREAREARRRRAESTADRGKGEAD
jgi:hypothetical protein